MHTKFFKKTYNSFKSEHPSKYKNPPESNNRDRIARTQKSLLPYFPEDPGYIYLLDCIACTENGFMNCVVKPINITPPLP